MKGKEINEYWHDNVSVYIWPVDDASRKTLPGYATQPGKVLHVGLPVVNTLDTRVRPQIVGKLGARKENL